jgi:outer membrane protein assembly factor BamB
MRHLVVLVFCLLSFGCGSRQAEPVTKSSAESTQAEPAAELATELAEPPTIPVLPAGPSDWPGFLGPTGDGVSSEAGIITPWPQDGLRVVWHQPVGTGYGAPAISDGRLYLFDRHDDLARLKCLDARTGAFVWKFEYPTNYVDSFGYNNGPRCCPVVDHDRVYIFGAEGMLHCVGTADGKPLWKVDTAKEFGVVANFFGVASVPAIEGDLLIVQVGGSPEGSSRHDFGNLKGNGSGVVAFDKRTGQVKYRITDELASYSGPVLATVNERRWCFVFARGGLLGFEPATGKVDFRHPWRADELESVNAANPVVVGDHVLISETYGPGAALLKVKPGGCEEVWTDAKKRPRDKSLMCHWSTPIYHAGYVYGCSGRHTQNAELRCVELATGKVMWREPRLTRTALMKVDGHFICLAEDGTLRLLKVNPRKYEEVSRLAVSDPKTGEPLLDYPCWAAPVLSHGLMYTRGPEYLVCLELIPDKK